nr:hypothetical protein [Methylobacterium sp. L1A1]
MADRWTDGLRDLDPVQTRKLLADLIFECHHVADGLERLQGEGLRDHVSITRLKLEKVAKEEITRLSRMLAKYKSRPPVAEPPKAADPATPRVTPPYDAYAAARARAEAKAAAEAEPAPAPAAPTRPQMPVRGMRLPKLLPGRPA